MISGLVVFVGLCMMTMTVAAGEARAQMDPWMTDILVTGGTGEMLLYARLVDGFKKEMEEAILAGAPRRFYDRTGRLSGKALLLGSAYPPQGNPPHH